MHTLIQDITLCIAAAWLFAVVARAARQPLILFYLLAGFALGPVGFGWVQSRDSVTTISELGLIFLLFMIGLEIDLKKIVTAGRSIALTALSQIGLGCVAGVVFFRALGAPLGVGGWDALYLGVAAALSSTVVIVKVLYDKRELDTLAGRVTLGVLVIQDLFAILFLALQPGLDDLKPSLVLLSLARAALLVASALLVSRFVLPALFRGVARLPELVVVGAIAWCLLGGELGARLHISREMGALVAGVALSTFPYALDVTAKVTSLRDFFVTLFFVGLGMQIPAPTGPLVAGAAIFAAFTVISRLLTTFAPLHLQRRGLRMSLVPSINLSQVSEFSLVIAALGIAAGHISPETGGVVALAFAALAALSTFAMLRSDFIVRRVKTVLERLGLKDLPRGDEAPAAPEEHERRGTIMLLGFHRAASSLFEELLRQAPDFVDAVVVVDFNPQVHEELKRRGVRAIYGDIAQRDTLVHAGIAAADVVVSTLPDSLLKGATNLKLVRTVRELSPRAKIVAQAENLPNIPQLYEAGADYVAAPRLGEALEVLAAIRAARQDLLEDLRARQAAMLTDRREVVP